MLTPTPSRRSNLQRNERIYPLMPVLFSGTMNWSLSGVRP